MSSPTYLPIFQYCVCSMFFMFLMPLKVLYSKKATKIWWKIPVDLSPGSICHIFVDCFRIYELQWSYLRSKLKIEGKTSVFTYGKYLKLRPFFSGFLVHLCMGVRWKFCPSDSISNKHNENWQAVLSLDKKFAKGHNFHRTILWQCTGKLEENQIVLS